MRESKKPHPLAAVQLEELLDLRNVKVLRTLRKPDTASGVAKTLELPANLVHYRIDKLLEVGLLRVRRDSGKGRIFQTVCETFSVPKTLVGELGRALPEMLEPLLNRVYREFFAEFERMALEFGTFSEEGDKVIVDLESNLGVSAERSVDRGRFHYLPRTAITSVRLGEASYEALAQTLRQTISEAQDEAGGDLCTFVVLSYRGGSLR